MQGKGESHTGRLRTLDIHKVMLKRCELLISSMMTGREDKEQVARDREKPSPKPQRLTLTPETCNRTGTSRSRSEDRPPCFKCTKEKNQQNNNCDNWHPPLCKFHKRSITVLIRTSQRGSIPETSGKKRNRDKVKDSYAIINTRKGGNSAHESKVHAKEETSKAVTHVGVNPWARYKENQRFCFF